MSSKGFQRKDLKHDQFVIGAGRVGQWLMDRRRRIGWGVLAVAVVVSVVFSVRFAHQRQEQQAAALLSAALEVYRAPVVPPAPEPVATPVADGSEPTADDAGNGTVAEGGEGEGQPAPAETPPAPATTGLQYASLADKNNAAIELLEPIVERYGGRPSGRLAAYYLGICQSELGNTENALVALNQAAEASAPLIADMALFRLGQLELGVGNAEGAVTYFDRLLDRAGPFPQEEVLMAKARAHENAGDPRAALAAYQRVLNEYADTYAAVEARSRAEELSAQLGVEFQEPGAQSS
jgi:tetratricopeptide (TPR) repeat protein